MPDKNQKDISAKYTKNREDLPKYKKTHPMRRLRFWLCVVAFFGGLVWALGFHKLGGTSEFFNTGPISQNHQVFAKKCEVCHLGASTDMLSILPIGAAKQTFDQGKDAVLNSLKTAGSRALASAQENLSDPHKLAQSMLSALGTLNLDAIDQSCLVCHGGMALHQPGRKAVMFSETVKEISLVSAGACTTCHKEHVGTARMGTPTSETCTNCHGNQKMLTASLQVVHHDGAAAKATSQNVILKNSSTPPKTGSREGHSQNWSVQWLPPATEGVAPKVIRAFADPDPNFSHPPFLYEQKGAQDQAKILFNHKLHVGPRDPVTGERKRAKDIPDNQEILDCRSCHLPDADGVGMQRISYEQHCQQCHGLSIDPQYPDLTVPHRDPEKVRKFLSNMRRAWVDYATERYPKATPQELDIFRQNREAEFVKSWPGSVDDWQERVFFKGNPPRLPACVKCHATQDGPGKTPVPAVKPGVPYPEVARTAIPDAFLTRGPFKHAAHLDLKCIDCHGAVEKSDWTQDISMPSVKLCAECHRPRDYQLAETVPTFRIAPTFGSFSPDAAAKQRKEGGVFADCLRCHSYHVPAAAVEIARGLTQ